MSTHAATPQSLLGKLQAIQQYTNPTGGINVHNVPIFPLTDFGFAKDTLYEGKTTLGLVVYQKLAHYKWIKDLAGVTDFFSGGANIQSYGHLPATNFLGFLPEKTTCTTGILVYEQNTQILGHDCTYTPGQGASIPLIYTNIWGRQALLATQDYKTQIGWYTRIAPICSGGTTIFVSDSTHTYWTNKNYPFLPSVNEAAELFVTIKVGASIAQHNYEYDIADGGLGGGGTTVIVVSGGGGGASAATLRIKQNAWFKLQLETEKGITGYDIIPSSVYCDLATGTLEGYLLTSAPSTTIFDLVGGTKFTLVLYPYTIERRAN